MARTIAFLFCACALHYGMARRVAKTPGAALTQEKADTWSSSSSHGCINGYCMESKCREEYREGWSSEEREECFDHGYNMRCDSGYVRGHANKCYWARVHCHKHWHDWSACSKKCGGGTMTRTASIHRHPAHGGNACGALQETKTCNQKPCPVNCAGEWGEFGTCSKSCGGGTHTRSFIVKTEAAHGGSDCPADESESCGEDPCPKDCEGSWGDWSQCSKTCGNGEQERVFTVTAEAENEGKECPTSLTEKQICENAACPVPVVEEKQNDDISNKDDLDDDLDLELEEEEEQNEDEWEKDPKAAVQKCRAPQTAPDGQEYPKKCQKQKKAECVCNMANKESLSASDKRKRCMRLMLDAMKVAGPHTCRYSGGSCIVVFPSRARSGQERCN